MLFFCAKTRLKQLNPSELATLLSLWTFSFSSLYCFSSSFTYIIIIIICLFNILINKLLYDWLIPWIINYHHHNIIQIRYTVECKSPCLIYKWTYNEHTPWFFSNVFFKCSRIYEHIYVYLCITMFIRNILSFE